MCQKLICNSYNKEKYVVHVRKSTKHGLIFKKYIGYKNLVKKFAWNLILI